MNIIVTKKSSKGLEVVFLNKKDLKSIKSETLKNSGFEAKNGQMTVDADILYVGIDGIKTADDWMVLGLKITQKLKLVKAKAAVIDVPKNCAAFVAGLQLGDYDFNTYKSEKKKATLKTIYLTSKSNIVKTVKKAVAGAQAQCAVRDLVNTPPNVATTTFIHDYIIDKFNDTDIKWNRYDAKKLKELKMEGHLAVGRASVQPTMVMKLTYTPKDYKEHKVFVGKGIIFDTGGYSLKPSGSITTMQADKGGAMTVIGMMEYVAKFGSEYKITAYLPLAENSISGDAYRPDDILTMKNGKTVRIVSTDAEGRLLLADSLALAQEENKDISKIYTVATLTGSAVVQFGDEGAGMVGYNDKLKKEVRKAGDKAGEDFLDAAFHKYMMDSVTSEGVADLTNTSNRRTMGCQTAGLFLTNFIKKKNKMKYLHLDIAGPAWVPAPFGVNPKNGTGFGTRTLINLVK